MFIFGLFESSKGCNDLKPALDLKLSSWLNRIREITPIQICFSNEEYLFGQGVVVGDYASKWFVSRFLNVGSSELYMQGFIHPKYSGVLSELLSEFRSFNERVKTIQRTLLSIFVEFSCVVYNRDSKDIFIISDKLGVVPVYIYRTYNYILYSSVLWVLKLFDNFKDDLNWQGIAEHLYFNAPIGDKTIYDSVSRVSGGKIMHFSRDGVRQVRYYDLWNTDLTVYKTKNVPELLANKFDLAVSERLSSHPIEYSTLSGGLDSRVVVSSLSKHQKKIITFNFMPPNMLDSHLSEMFAKKIGTVHYNYPVYGISFPNFSMLSRNFISTVVKNNDDEPISVWTGDDGSISIGLVYLRRHLLNTLNSLDHDRMFSYLLDGAKLPTRIFKIKWLNQFRDRAFSGLKQFFDTINVENNAAGYYCFFILNRVARMFDNHYETAHLHRIFRLMPFLDVRTIEPVLSLDLPESSEHRLYLNFARFISSQILEVPWQAYPGHEPCLLPLPNAKNQWQPRDIEEERYLRKAAQKRTLAVIKSKVWRQVLRHEVLFAYLILDLISSNVRCGATKTCYDIHKIYGFTGLNISDNFY